MIAPVAIDCILLSRDAVDGYLSALRALTAALPAGADIADEQFVPLAAGDGWIAIPVRVSGEDVMVCIHRLAPGDWCWVGPMGRGGVA